MGNIREAILLKKSGSSSQNSHQLPADSQQELENHEPLSCPCYEFKWRGMVTLKDDRGSSASLTISSCVARNPSFAGNSPWTLNITYWSTTGETAVDAPTTAEFDPETDILVASVATFNYVINNAARLVSQTAKRPTRADNGHRR